MTSRGFIAVVLSTTLFGFVLGLVDAVDTLAGGFDAGLRMGGFIVVTFNCAAVLGLVGMGAGVLTSSVAWLASRIGIKYLPDLGLSIRAVGLASGRLTRAIVLAATLGFCAASYGAILWLLYGSGAGTSWAVALICTAALGTTVALVGVLSRKWCPHRAHTILWALATIGFYILETRLLYMFSRLGGKVGFAHVTLLLLFLAGGGAWLYFAGVGRLLESHSRRRIILSAALLGTIAALLVGSVECFGSHRVRLVVHGRTSLAFQAFSFLPNGRAHQIASMRRRWQRICGDKPSHFPVKHSEEHDDFRKPALRGVVLVLIDSLRSDRVEMFRHGDPLMPNLARLRRRAAFFPNVYTTSPGTTKALGSIMSSRFADELDPTEVRLDQALHAAGIRTIAVSGHPNVAKQASGFDVLDTSGSIERFSDHKNATTSKAIITRALAQLAEVSESDRFFALVHLFDPHAHYVANPDFDFGWSEKDRYDAEVKYTDKWLARLIDELEAVDSVGLVIVSDHGDEFWEHRYKRHQLRLYDESTRVPLVIDDPRSRHASLHTVEASLLDVAPTILDLLGVNAPPSMTGQSLVPVIDGGLRPDSAVRIVSTNGQKRAIVHNRRKLILDLRSGILEFYDLERDPDETNNLADSGTEDMDETACALEAWLNTRSAD